MVAPTLLTRIGASLGIEPMVAVDTVASEFVDKLLGDPRVSHFFKGKTNHKKHLANFVSVAFGKPDAKYNLTKAHAGMGMTAEHFGIVADHLQDVMMSLNIPEDLAAEAMAKVESTKSAVLGEGTVIGGRPLVPGEEPLVPGNPNYETWLPVTEFDEKDARTPDHWIPRWSSLIRLTGKHPLNAEPPHLELMEAGWLTPVSKHFVRSHGAVPKIAWEEHRIHVVGMVEEELVLSMEDILKLEPITIPVLLTCSGNRRQEMNAEKKTQCFPYGPCAVGVNWWTGARLSDILKMAGCKQLRDGARFVHISGPKNELPKGDGTYATHIPLGHALDESMEIIVAYKQNGQYLHPDHGFPARCIIPGWIAGRMVKWLSEIKVTDTESDNYYHFYDNKALPPHVEQEEADRDGWWFDNKYLIFEHSVNSVMHRPAHDERIVFDKNRPYTIKGYALSGGGRMITRVEVSLDKGISWSKPARLIFTEKPNAYGKYWTWVFWELEVETYQLLSSEEVSCRAWDTTQNTQPYVLTWNILGQGNNSMFRLRVHKELDEEGRICIRFQQPAPLLAGQFGSIGWREEDNDRVPPLSAAAQRAAATAEVPLPSISAMSLDPSKKYVTQEMVSRHTTRDSIWFVHEGKVYDATSYLDEHPGGEDSILVVGGQDATDDFNITHSETARQMLNKYYIADLAPEGLTIPAEQVYGGATTAVISRSRQTMLPTPPPLQVDSPGGNAGLPHGWPVPVGERDTTGFPALPDAHTMEESEISYMSNATVVSAASAAAQAAAVAAAAATAAASAATAAAAALSTAGSVTATTPGSSADVYHQKSSFSDITGMLLAPVATASRVAPYLSTKQYKPAQLRQKIQVSHNSYIFRFALDHPSQRLGLPVGQHLFVKKTGISGAGKEETAMRAYTPVTGDETPGHFDLLVKIYRPDTHPSFPNGGKLSTILENMKLGDTIEVKGPVGSFIYTAPGSYTYKGQQGAVQRFNMVAGGSGITPMYQVITAILSNASDNTQIKLVYANRGEGDILLRQELDALAAAKPQQFQVHYTLSDPGPQWPHSRGFVNLMMFHRYLFQAKEGTLTLLSGPAAMMKQACHPNLEQMGFEQGSTSIEL